MKIRKGFVSNSSSSSFLCDACGNMEGGFDAGLADVGMVECEGGHTLDIHCCIEDENGFTVEQYLDGDCQSDGNDEDIDRYAVPRRFCPICMFKTIDNADLKKYVYKTYMSEKALIEKIHVDFKDYNEFRKFLYGK